MSVPTLIRLLGFIAARQLEAHPPPVQPRKASRSNGPAADPAADPPKLARAKSRAPPRTKMPRRSP